MQSLDRRTTPRFDVRCYGELVWGDAIVDVEIVDMSMTGCGVRLSDATGLGQGSQAILNIRTDQPKLGVMLPVGVINRRDEDGVARCGLEYKRLSKRQVRNLIALMHEVVTD